MIAQTHGQREWTVLYYTGTNLGKRYESLDPYVQQQLESVSRNMGADDRVTIVGQKGTYMSGEATRMHIRPADADGKLNVDEVARLGVTDLGDARTLEDFLTWGIKTYPAKHYLVVMGGHGGAWFGALPDDLHQDILTMSRLKSAFDGAAQEAGRKIDVVDFDCCLLSCVEAADALKRSVNFIHASEEVSSGEDHGRLTHGIYENLATRTLDVPKMLKLIEDSWMHPTAIATMRCDRVDGFNESARTFAQALLRTSTRPEVIVAAFAASQHLFVQPDVSDAVKRCYGQVRDVVSLADHIAQAPDIADLKAAARHVADYVRTQLLVSSTVADPDLPDAHGVSIYAPTVGAERFADEYAQTSFARATGWDEVVRRFGAADARAVQVGAGLVGDAHAGAGLVGDAHA